MFWRLPLLVFWLFVIVVWCVAFIVALPFILIAFIIDECKR